MEKGPRAPQQTYKSARETMWAAANEDRVDGRRIKIQGEVGRENETCINHERRDSGGECLAFPINWSKRLRFMKNVPAFAFGSRCL